jgi:ABC-type arginine transport system permease subunit
VPDLVMLLLVYFGGQRLVNVVADGLGLGPVSVSPFLAGVIVLGFIYGGYLTETFRGAYMTIPPGQVEAARALGLRGFTLHRKVTLPQAIRFALAGYANVWQVLVKSTAVVSVIGLHDVVGLANEAGKTTREPFLFFSAVLAVYLFVTWASTSIFDRLENRYALVGHAD